MAGLLDGGLSGDDTVKDEYGQTQADRRDPIWSGLIRAGLLAVAGGGKLMPEQRAQYIAQAGGALADIPKDMQAAASAAAQQKLRGQQLDEGKRKVADRDRIRQMMQAPEIQDIVNNAKGADKIAIQAAIQTGDIGALNTAIGNLDKSGLNAEKLSVAQQRLELAKEKQKHGEENQGPMKGTGEPQQLRNWLMTKPPDSQEYAQAYDFFSKDQTINQNGIVTTIPKLDLDGMGYAKPTWKGTAPPAAQPPPPPPSGTDTLPNGNTREMSADGKTLTITDPKTGIQTIQEEGKPPRTVQPKAVDPQSERKFNDAEVEGKAIIQGLENFRKISRNAKPEDRIRSVLGFSTALNTSYGITTMLAKGEALFNLGVLNGQDLDVLRRILPDPSTFKGTLSDADAAIDQVIEIINTRLKTREAQIYPRGRPGKSADPAAPKVPTWNPATGKLE